MALTNSQMIAGRFASWARARKIAAWVDARLSEGLTVYVQTHTRATKLSPKHRGIIYANKAGAWMKSGKSAVCVNYCKFTAQ